MNKKTLAWAACLVFSLVSGMPAAQAQSAYPPPAASYTQTQLDQMLAPVALYPDSLLAQVLMASTYPLEVVQAQRFVEARPGLHGDGLARAVAPMPWDPSVKSLVQFPSVLAMMNDRLDWMQQLGQAFLSQQAAVMDTVQNLRERAQIAGSLRSSPQQRVLVSDDVIVIEPVDPQVVYVPYYNPVVVYGSWWWPANPPVYWEPPPRYRPPQYTPGVTVGISFSSGIGIGVIRAAFGDARPDWHQRQVMVTQTNITNVTNNVTNNVTVNRNVTVNQRPVAWHHDYARYGGARPQQRPNAQQPNMPPSRPQQAQPAAQLQAQQQHPERPAMPPAANPQQRVIQEDQARQRQVREQQASQVREVQAQQQQREHLAQEQQRQREQQANNQQRQREQLAQQQQMQQQQRQQQMHEQQVREQQIREQQQVREQQRQAQQARPQPEQMHREQQARPQPQQREERPQERRRDERRDERRDDKG